MTKITFCISNKHRNSESKGVVYSCWFTYYIRMYTYCNCNELLILQVRKARQVWMEIDVDDFVAAGCKWAEVSDNLWVT